MVTTGEALSPSFNGRPRFEKPPLFYWLQLPFFLALGATETAARLPSALAGVGCVVLLYLMGRSFFTERAALLAGLALATVFRFVAYARQGLTDVPAMFFEIAALYGFLRASDNGPRANRYAMAGWTAVALCALTKGPVAVIPVAVFTSYLALTRDWPAIARWRPGAGVLLACAICLPWYALMAAVHGRTFLDVAIGYEVIQRVVAFPAPSRGFWYYASIWPGDALPWTMFFVLGWIHAATEWRSLEDPARRGLVLCGIWFGGVLVLFSVASGKLPHYLLPLYAPLALVAGFYLDRVVEGVAGLRPWQAAAVLTGGALGVLAIVAARFLVAALGTGPLHVGMLLPGILAVGGLAVVLGAAFSKPLAGTFALVVTLVTLYVFIASVTLPRQLSGLHPTAQLGRALARVVQASDRIGMLDAVPSPALVFYLRHTVEPIPSPAGVQRFLESGGRAFCIVRERDVAGLVGQSRTPLYEVARRPKLVVRFNRLFGRETANLYDSDLVVLSNQPVGPQ